MTHGHGRLSLEQTGTVDTKLYLDSMICRNGQNYCSLQFFNEIMYVGIAEAKTERLN